MGKSVSALYAIRLALCSTLLVLISSSHGFCLENLIPNPEFITPQDDPLNPHFWYHGSSEIEGIKKSEFSLRLSGNPPLRSLGIKGGEDRSGEWWCNLEGLEKGKDYLLAFKAYREDFKDGIFPEVEIFNNRLRLNNHLTYGGWQDFTLRFRAVSESTVLKFINNYHVQFYFSSIALFKEEGLQKPSPAASKKAGPVIRKDFFPLIAYGARKDDFHFLRGLGFNGVVIGINSDKTDDVLNSAEKEGLVIVANTGDDWVIRKLSRSETILGWYVEDEPEGKSVPVENILKKKDLIRENNSQHPAFMAMVRPEFVGYYREAADIILMDQYPVPDEPLVWLSKSMDYAKGLSNGKDIWAVIQIFGGQGWKDKGWDREPTYDEMKALSYLAIVHGARGLFFYTIKDGNYDLKKDQTHLRNVRRLMQELRSISPLFLSDTSGALEFSSMSSLYEYAPDGTKAVHLRMLKNGKRIYVIAVNVLDKNVSGTLSGMDSSIRYLDEFFSGKRYVVKDRNIVDEFKPYEVKLYISGKTYTKIKVIDGKTNNVKAGLYGEVAETLFDKTIGLSFRELSSEDRAFVILNNTPRDMKIHALNMKGPFDLIFVDSEDRVSDIYVSVPQCEGAHECKTYKASKPSKSAIELVEGATGKLNIKVGDSVEFY